MISVIEVMLIHYRSIADTLQITHIRIKFFNTICIYLSLLYANKNALRFPDKVNILKDHLIIFINYITYSEFSLHNDVNITDQKSHDLTVDCTIVRSFRNHFEVEN